MIVKELDTPSTSVDALVKAGRMAEEQMAFYLRRAFKDDPCVRVVNGLRVVYDGEAAQIDHLVLHPYGLFVIESKSVTTKVKINKHGEWARWYNGSYSGMSSPILQAQRQADVLGDLLLTQRNLSCADLIVDVIVAISDNGLIERPEDVDIRDVCKADQVGLLLRD